MKTAPGAEITLTLTNRDAVIEFLRDADGTAHEPKDPGSDVVLIDLPDRRVCIVLGYTVTRDDTGYVVFTRNGDERARIPVRS